MTRALRAKAAIAALLLAMSGASVALACPTAPVASVAGPVLAVPEAGVICVALGPRPEQWVRVRLAGGEHLDRKRLMAVAFSKRVECAQGAGGWSCRVGAEDLALLAGAPATGLIAAGWR